MVPISFRTIYIHRRIAAGFCYAGWVPCQHIEGLLDLGRIVNGNVLRPKARIRCQKTDSDRIRFSVHTNSFRNHSIYNRLYEELRFSVITARIHMVG